MILLSFFIFSYFIYIALETDLPKDGAFGGPTSTCFQVGLSWCWDPLSAVWFATLDHSHSSDHVFVQCHLISPTPTPPKKKKKPFHSMSENMVFFFWIVRYWICFFNVHEFEFFWESLKVYMVVNFRACGINRSTRKLIRPLTLINKRN